MKTPGDDGGAEGEARPTRSGSAGAASPQRAPIPFQPVAVLFLASVFLLWRNPQILLRPELWAEDGLWVAGAYNEGWASVLEPHTGYFQTFPRLVALICGFLPIGWTPLLFAVAGFAIQILPAAILLTRQFATLLPSIRARYLLIIFYIGMPNSSETFVHLTDAQWHLAIVMFLFIVTPAPVTWGGRAAKGAFLATAGLSGPFSILLMPFSWWEAWQRPKRDAAANAAIVTITAAIQLICILINANPDRSPAPLGAGLIILIHILLGQILLGGMLGTQWVIHFSRLTIWWQNELWVVLVFALCISAIVTALIRGTGVYRKFTLFAALVLAVSLISPVASGVTPQWQALAVPGAGSRYYLLPILAWFATILTLAAASAKILRWPARCLLLVFTIGMAADWQYPIYAHTTFQKSAQRFAAAPAGVTVIFPEDPDPMVWAISLTKH